MPTTLALELHDVDAVAHSASGAGAATAAATVPAFVRLDGQALLIGEPALDGARFLPRQVHDRFYEELGEKRLEHPFPTSWRTADLAHAHIAETWRRSLAATPEIGGEKSPVILICGGLDEDRLPLLLGITRSVGLAIGGVVPSSLAAAVAFDLPERSMHLELYRHRAVGTHLRREGETIHGERTEVDPDISFTRLRAAQVKAAARAFIRETRYDPLATAAGEQQLYDRLPGWLATLEHHPRIDARLGQGGVTAAIELDRAEMVDATTDVAKRLARLATGASTVLLGAHAAALGVSEYLQRAGHKVQALDAGAPCRGALAARREILTAGPDLFLLALRQK